jgi:hypothetical protein
MRFEQRPIVGRITLLSALVKAYKPRHRLGPDPVSGSFLYTNKVPGDFALLEVA